MTITIESSADIPDIPTRVSGIYAICNVLDGKRYIGQAVCLRRRAVRHWTELKYKYHCNIVLQRAYLKHGANSFRFEILEICEKDRLTEREQFWIDSFAPAALYNICLIAESIIGRPVSQKARKKISKALMGHPYYPLTPEGRERISKAGKKRHPTPLNLEKLRIASSKRRGVKRWSEEDKKRIGAFFSAIPRHKEWCENISKALKGRPAPARSDEEKRRISQSISAALKAAWAKRREATT